MTGTSLSKKTQSKKPAKPDKPYPEFPLTPHGSGKWCKKVRGKIYYFGSWDDPNGAIQEWLAVRDELLGGADPNRNAGRHDVDHLVNTFLTSKDQQKNQGDLSPRTWKDYFDVCKRFSNFIGETRFVDGLKVDDFARYRASFPATWGPIRINSEITKLSVVLNFAYEAELVDKPIRTGPNFKRVSQKKQRLHRATKTKKLFSAADLHRMVDAATVQMKAMILMGINCGYGNADVGRLQIDDIDFGKSWIGGLRQKTGVERAAWLWPETKKALRDAIEARYDNLPASLEGHVFVTKRRQAWFQENGRTAEPLSAEFKKLGLAVGCYKKGVGFYALRHTFETIGGDSRDQIAVNYVMGHSDPSMADVYREGIDPKRIKAVCQHVRKWFLAGAAKPKKTVAKKGGAK